MKHLLFLLLLALAANAHGQCDQFDNLLKKGDAYLKGKKPNYQEAINAYTAAILACSDRASEAQKRLAKMVSDINKLKENAEAAERKAIKAQEETKAALARSDSLYEVADAERRRAEAVLDKIYFYDDRFGLASQSANLGVIMYGFIDKQLNTKIDFQFTEALPFDETGYAKVKKGDDRYYLIDTTGTEFLLATDVSQIAPDVTALDLRNKNLSKIPDTVFSQIQLKVLLLANNRLDTLSAEIGQLKNLQSLYLSSNQLSSLPAEIGQLNSLQSLELYGNKLNSLPAEIGQLQNLQSLNFNGNKLSSLPAKFGQLQKLQSLDLAWNQLSSLPAEIGQLKNLQSLYLWNNQLSSLPAEIGQLKNLQSLRLRGNQLSSLPVEIGQLQKLRSLSLRGNRLSSLPAEVGQLKNLQVLDLFRNQLSSLPAEIRSMKLLETLYLQNNPFTAEYIEQLRKDMPWCEIEF